MKALLLAGALAALASGAAQAAPVGPISQVTVAIGPGLQAKAKTYGQRELDKLAVELEDDVVRTLSRTGGMAPGGAKLHLILADAVPNRPTFKQLGDRVGLSFESFGVGGASIEGEVIYPDGRTEPVRYKWYETDIRQSYARYTWGDATDTFMRFADRLARGQVYAER